MEEQIRQAGIPCHGKDVIPKIDELNPNIVAEGILKEKAEASTFPIPYSYPVRRLSAQAVRTALFL